MSSEMKWKLVPVEPTEEMLCAGADAYTDYVAFETVGDKIGRVFKRMLAAAPNNADAIAIGRAALAAIDREK